MATFNKFQDFVEQLGKGVHQLHAAGHTLKVFLTNEAPLAADTVKADMVEITAQNGRPSGGSDIQNDCSEGNMQATAYVYAADIVVVVLHNVTGGAVDLGSGTWKVWAERI